MKKLLLVVMSLVCMLLIAACAGQKEAGEEGSRVLKVGVDANFPPFEYYQKGTDNFTGFDVELMRGVAANMGYSGVEFVNTGLNDLINGLNGKRYDVIASGFSVTPERQQAVDFSESYLNDGFRIAVAAGNDFTADNISALKDKIVAVKHNSFALAMVNNFGGAAKVIETPSIEEAMAKVIGGEADCAVISKSAGSFFIANGYADKIKFASGDLKTDNVALAVRKGDKEFLSKLNEGLRNFRKSQEFERLKKTYFGEF